MTKIGSAIEYPSDVKSSVSGESFSSDEPLYYSFAKIDGKEQKAYLGEKEAFRSDSPYRANPLIFYRVKQPANDISKLPLLNLTKFYE